MAGGGECGGETEGDQGSEGEGKEEEIEKGHEETPAVHYITKYFVLDPRA